MSDRNDLLFETMNIAKNLAGSVAAALIGAQGDPDRAIAILGQTNVDEDCPVDTRVCAQQAIREARDRIFT